MNDEQSSTAESSLSQFSVHRSSLLHERNLIDLTKRGASFHHFLQCRFSQEGHPLFFRRFLDLRRRAPIENHSANTIGEVEKFRDGRAAVESRSIALQAARALGEKLVAI